MDHLTRSLANGLVYAALERVGEIRAHEDRLRALLAGSECRLVPVWLDRNLVADGDDVRAVWLTPDDLPLDDGECPIFLGMIDERACFAVALGDNDPRLAQLERHGRFTELRGIGPVMADPDASVLSYARGMCHWHRRHVYCGACGERTISIQGGHVRQCTNEQCGIHHFPRTDPAIIVLVNDRDACLLGRKREWPAGRYSTIAGFVEPGEAVEQAVVREVREETAIGVDEVSYHSSQPWPFPGSVMLGFHARASAPRDIELLDGELEDARWFSRHEVGQALEGTGPLRLPPKISIARRLIEDWYHHGHL